MKEDLPLFRVERPWRDFILPSLAGEPLPDLDVVSRDPVSRNETGVYEAFAHRVFAPGSREARWNSFNLGELLFPHSLWSLAPLLVILAAGCWLALVPRGSVRGPPPGGS